MTIFENKEKYLDISIRANFRWMLFGCAFFNRKLLDTLPQTYSIILYFGFFEVLINWGENKGRLSKEEYKKFKAMMKRHKK